jgi:FkbM family methyltransferase
VAAGTEHEPVLRTLGNVRMVVDVGANRGQFALVARHCFPEARIVSFEPLPRPASRFARVFARDPAVVLHQVAIGPEEEVATMHVSSKDDSSSLLPMTVLQNRLFPRTAEVDTQQVRTTQLTHFITDSQIDRPALLKLDVQGFELQALQGCAELLKAFSYIYVECSFVELYANQVLADEVIAWLRKRNSRLVGIHNVSYDRGGRAIQADFLFANNCSY